MEGHPAQLYTGSWHCSPQGTTPRVQGPLSSCRKKPHLPETQREKLYLQSFWKPPPKPPHPRKRGGWGGGGNPGNLEPWLGMPGCPQVRGTRSQHPKAQVASLKRATSKRLPQPITADAVSVSLLCHTDHRNLTAQPPLSARTSEMPQKYNALSSQDPRPHA